MANVTEKSNCNIPGKVQRVISSGWVEQKPQYWGEGKSRWSAECTVCMRAHHGVQLFVTAWPAACQVPLSMEFSKQEYRSGLPFPPPGDLPDSGTEPKPLASPALAGKFFSH